LRSEDVKEIIGKIPPHVIRMGISVIFIALISLFAYMSFLKYPEYIEAPVQIEKCDSIKRNYLALIEVPSKDIWKIKPDQRVFISLEQYPNKEFGYITSKVKNIYSQIHIKDSRKYYLVSAYIEDKLTTSSGFNIVYLEGLYGIAEIEIENRSIFKKMLPMF